MFSLIGSADKFNLLLWRHPNLHYNRALWTTPDNVLRNKASFGRIIGTAGIMTLFSYLGWSGGSAAPCATRLQASTTSIQCNVQEQNQLTAADGEGNITSR